MVNQLQPTAFDLALQSNKAAQDVLTRSSEWMVPEDRSVPDAQGGASFLEGKACLDVALLGGAEPLEQPGLSAAVGVGQQADHEHGGCSNSINVARSASKTSHPRVPALPQSTFLLGLDPQQGSRL